MKRRRFVRDAGLATGAAVVFPGALLSGTRDRATAGAPDLVLRGGLVFDGLGNPPIEADVAVVGGRISEIARRITARGADELDVRGLALAPGFVDIHSHSDTNVLIDRRAPSKVRQGVTTEVVGADGGSIGPMTKPEFQAMQRRYQERYGVAIDFHDIGGYLRFLDRRPAAVNIATMVGAGRVRGYVMGDDDRPATAEELARMVAEVEGAVRQGACGLSSGLEYTPGGFASLEELVAVARPLAGTGLPYASHMRNEDDRLLSAVEEAINVGRFAGVPVQISHLKAQGQRNWWKAAPALEVIAQANADSLDVRFDVYPYIAYSTGLANLFPLWSRDGGNDAFGRRLQDPALRPRLEGLVRDKIASLGSWDAVQVTSTTDDAMAWARGRRLGELAAERGTDPYELLLQLLLGGGGGMVGFGMSEENVAKFIAHPLSMICSDGGALATEGPLSAGTPHPRNYGAFPRVLGHYVREKRVLPLETALKKMTSTPADRVGLRDRGRIVPGGFADLVVFDPDRVVDTATFAAPHSYAAGIPHVLVNGSFVLRDGEFTDARPGRALRPGPPVR